MNRPAWMILTIGLADGYELTKSPARVKEARENGQTVIDLAEIWWKDGVLHVRQVGVIHQLTVIAKVEP